MRHSCHSLHVSLPPISSPPSSPLIDGKLEKITDANDGRYVVYLKNPAVSFDANTCECLKAQLYQASSQRGSPAKVASMNSMLNQLFELLYASGIPLHWWYFGQAISTKARFLKGYATQPVGVVMNVFAANDIPFASYGVVSMATANLYAKTCNVKLADVITIMELALMHGVGTSASDGGLNSATDGKYIPHLPVKTMFHAIRLSANEYMATNPGVSLSDALAVVGARTPEDVFEQFLVELATLQNGGVSPLTAQAAYDLVQIMGSEASRTLEEPSWRVALFAGLNDLVTPAAALAVETVRDIAQQKRRPGGEAFAVTALLKAAEYGRMIVSGTVSYSLDGKKVNENFSARPIIYIDSGRRAVIRCNINNKRRAIPLFSERNVAFQLTKLKGEIKRMNATGKRAWKKLGYKNRI